MNVREALSNAKWSLVMVGSFIIVLGLMWLVTAMTGVAFALVFVAFYKIVSAIWSFWPGSLLIALGIFAIIYSNELQRYEIAIESLRETGPGVCQKCPYDYREKVVRRWRVLCEYEEWWDLCKFCTSLNAQKFTKSDRYKYAGRRLFDRTFPVMFWLLAGCFIVWVLKNGTAGS